MSGYSPCLLDDIVEGRLQAPEPPNLEDLLSGQTRYSGDLVKIGGIPHIWDGAEWASFEDAAQRIYAIQASRP